MHNVKDNKKTNKKIFIRYIITTAIAILVISIVLFLSIFIYILANGKKNNNIEHRIIINTEQKIKTNDNSDENNNDTNIKKNINNISDDKSEKLLDKIIEAPRKTNIMILGMDQGSALSDVNIVVSFDSKTKKIDVISVPRDTYIKLTKEEIKELNAAKRYPPNSMKLTDLHSYAGEKLGHTWSQKKIEEIMGIKIDYYAEIQLDAFREIVDLVGGVEVEIPKGGLKYNDPEQNLRISIPGGLQKLTGKQAEGVVRYRSTYVRGDLDRIDMQKRFMKQFFAQITKKDIIIRNIPGFISTIIGYVNTDFGLSDIPQYLTSLDGISSENMSFYTLPGEAKYFNGGWYYVEDKEEIKKLVDKTILNYDINAQQNIEDINNSELLKIQILNGSDKSTISYKIQKKLEDAKYYVVDGGDYLDSKTIKTRILVKKEEDGEELKQYFNNAEVKVADDIPDKYDIIVILGKSE